MLWWLINPSISINGLSTLINAFANILWPIITLILILYFRSEISNILKRVIKGKIFGQEIEFQENLDDLERKVSVSESKLGPAPTPTEDDNNRELKLPIIIDKILEEAQNNPKASLLALGAIIEKDVSHILAQLGMTDYVNSPLLTKIRILDQRGSLPKHMIGSVELFWRIRNQIVHDNTVDKDNILRAIDSGIAILKILYAIPHEVNVVYQPGVPVYSDAGCVHQREGIVGVILETTAPGGTRKDKRIFPTNRIYKKGKIVSWEWDNGKIWTETWYKDPDTNEIKQAWGASMEFIGRHIDEI